MDILSHGLWGAAASKLISNKKEKDGGGHKINFRWGFFWGIFPDLFAFIIPVLWFFGSMIFGDVGFRDWPKPNHGEPPQMNGSWLFNVLAPSLYNVSHSLVIFAIVFIIFWLIFKHPHFELVGWLLHILADIPTHSYAFYPTPVFWPISDLKFSGFSWSHWWFVIPNYFVLGIVYFLLFRKKKAAISPINS